MATLAERFEAKVDRTGGHHLWLGARRPDGAGQLKINGTILTAQRVAWELEHGALPNGAKVNACPEVRACVRIDHLSLSGRQAGKKKGSRQRARRGSGSKQKLGDGWWKLTVRAGRYADGRPRREHENIRAETEQEANQELARFVADVHSAPLPPSQAERDLTTDEAIEKYLDHLAEDKGRETATIRGYRGVHKKWFSPKIGGRRVRDVDDEVLDDIFGKMRRAGLSASRMNEARSLYVPFFRWARRRKITRRSPMTDFELPTSTQVARERIAPEVDQVSLYLKTAVEVAPDVAPVLTLDAVTGMRPGELVTIRRTALRPADPMIVVATAIDPEGKVKTTKTRKERDVHVDGATMDMLVRHCARMDERAALFGTAVAPDGFVFSLEPDCSQPMPGGYLTKEVAKLKDHLGIPDKRPETIELEDQALRLRREPVERPRGKPGPAPKSDGMSYTEIGALLGRSDVWARKAVASAERREAALSRGDTEWFDGSVMALRKFTSSELLDAGFNIKVVAQRQGHSPEVLVKHYAKRRPSADRKAAEHLGEVVHGRRATSPKAPGL